MKGRKKNSREALTPREAPRARVFRYLERAIASGEIPQGGEIPSERALAALLGVSQNTAAAAVDEAEARGFVVRREGTRKRYAGDVPLKPSSTSTVYVLAGLVEFADVTTAPMWADSFLALDILRRLSLRGHQVSFVNTNLMPKGGLDAIFAAHPCAVAVTDSVGGNAIAMETLRRCREAGIPAVAYGNAPELRGFDRAYSDHRAGSRDLTRWLLARGRRRIVPLFPNEPKLFWEHERLAGYAEAMREAGLEPHPVKVFGSPIVAHGRTGENLRVNAALAVAALVELRRADGEFPDALLCSNDDWAKPVLAAISDMGLDPRRDILVAGYDNMSRGAPANGTAAGCDPALVPVVTVEKHNERTAEDMADLLLDRMEGALPPEPQARIHAHEVVVLSPEFTNPKQQKEYLK